MIEQRINLTSAVNDFLKEHTFLKSISPNNREGRGEKKLKRKWEIGKT